MKNSIVAVLVALYIAGAVASFWSGADVSYVIAWAMLAGMTVAGVVGWAKRSRIS